MFVAPLAATLALVVGNADASSTDAAPRAGESSPTIAEELLSWEGRYLATPPEMKQLLAAVLRDARDAIAHAQSNLSSLDEQERGLATLRIIEDVLASHHFVYPPREYVGPLHDGLANLSFDAAERAFLADRDENYGRGAVIASATERTVFHVVDCDLYSLIYVSIGQALDLPISMVDHPAGRGEIGHDYVAWTLSDGSWLAWEAMAGTRRDRVRHRTAQGARSHRPMTLQEIRGYAHWLSSFAAKRVGNRAGEATELREAVALAPDLTETLNALVWVLATCVDPAIRDPKEAASRAEHLLELSDAPNELDTAAAAFAAAGDWKRARELQQKAADEDPKFVDALHRYEKCQPRVALRAAEADLGYSKHIEDSLPDVCAPSRTGT